MDNEGDRLPVETSASAARRRQLSQGWLTEADADWRLGAAAAAALARRSGKVLAVWISGEGTYLYPDFQFASPDALEAMPELLSWLPKTTGSGWDQIEWLYSPHALLTRRTSAEAFRRNPREVVALAEREFSEDSNESW